MGAPLLVLGVNRIRVKSNLGKEFVEKAEKLGIASAKSLLEELGI